MSITYVHLSDIHFGQEKGSAVVINNDAKERLIEDAAEQVKLHAGGDAKGLIVTGDIAYAGKPEEYAAAAKWLDRLAKAVGCPRTAVKLVPGNHDIDRDRLSAGCTHLIDEILSGGEAKLDQFLANDDDCKTLYNRFVGYEPFALGYDCPLHPGGGIASDSREELAPGRAIRFFGLNSALICSKRKDEEGKLILGAAQRVLPIEPGVELVATSQTLSDLPVLVRPWVATGSPDHARTSQRRRSPDQSPSRGLGGRCPPARSSRHSCAPRE